MCRCWRTTSLLSRAEGLLIDATLGGGCHSALLLERNPGWRLIGLDQDPTARAAAERLAPFAEGFRSLPPITPDTHALMVRTWG